MTVDLVTENLAQLVRERVTPVLGEHVAGMVVDMLDDTSRRTIARDGDEATIITGDIPAVWLRDSCAQMAPFLRLAPHVDEATREQILEVSSAILRRHWRMILIDPYANAFKTDPSVPGWDPNDQPTPDPWCWERKFELDSLAFPLTMMARLHQLGDDSAATPRMARAMQRILDVYTLETDHEDESSYWFRRPDTLPTDTLARDGRGSLTAPTGLIWAGFRPSDDACELGFNVPGNFFAAKALGDLAMLARELREHPSFADSDAAGLADRAEVLRTQVIEVLGEQAVLPGPLGEDILAYEIDGLGGYLVMDDANNPSLMGLPYLDALPEGFERVWQATRRVLLSTHNPWYFEGSALAGIGSPHTGPGKVWPIALATQGLVSGDAAERERIIALLVETTAGTDRMHEGIDVDDPSQFTREWFSWANSMFCELVLEHCGV